MWTFGFPLLTWGFLLALAPLLIHLINLLRHKRVKWAAMDFLLQSYKKHRKWVWLRQLLLLLSRMAAIVLLVALLAQWKPQRGWFAKFSGAAAHHYILLDDSFSMSERTGGATSFDQGLQAVRAIAARVLEQDGPQRLTLIRFTRAEAAGNPTSAEEAAASLADLNAASVDGRFERELEALQRQLAPSDLAASPLAALSLTRQLTAGDDFGAKLVYVISDFRAAQWEKPAEIRAALVELQKQGAQVELVHCARQAQPNLAIVDLQPEPGPRVAGVPLFVTVTVRNFGETLARNVQLKVRSRFFDPSLAMSAVPGSFAGEVEELPMELIESIAPGATVTRRVQVYFPKPGRHVVEASLPEDAIAADNRRWCVIDFRAGEPVLIIDGDSAQRNAFYLESIFQPGPNARTGIQPVVKDVNYLRDTPLEELQRYSTIYLLDVSTCDQRGVENLEAFVKSGGGLAIFLGPLVDRQFYNKSMYRDGQGILPMPLEEQELMPATDEAEPDINVEGSQHPVFRDLLAGRNPILRMAHVDRYFAPPALWRPGENSSVQIIAGLRGGDPFMVEQSFGEGRVILCTTTYAPIWNDMALGPNALLALQLQAYLAQGSRKLEQRVAGAPLRVEFNMKETQPRIKYVLPGTDGTPQRVVDASIATPGDGAMGVAVLGGRGSDAASPGISANTNRSGIYELWSTSVTGATDIRRFALNVDPIESDPALVDMRALLAHLMPVRPDWHYADQAQFGTINPANLPPNMILLALLIALLIGEQALAYAASYHPPRGGLR